MTLQEAQHIVFEAKPVFAELYKTYKQATWTEYAQANYPTDRDTSPSDKLSSDFIESFRKVSLPLLGKRKSEHAISTLIKTRFVSTADHHGILCHPFFSNTTLVRSMNESKKPGSIITLSCGGVSLSNTSYPRGIFFHDSNLKQVRMPFISLHTKHLPVYGHIGITKEKLSKEKEKVSNLHISKLAKEKLSAYYDKLLNARNMWKTALFSDQATIANSLLWETLFDSKRGNLVYIEAETLMRQLLLDTHLEQNTLIHKILFDSAVRSSYIKHFEQVIGAHDSKNKKGTHLFWYIDTKERKRKQLWVKNDQLFTEDGSIRIPLNPDSIREQLLNHSIMPSMAFCYSTFAFYYGVTLGGGFSQIQYLNDMKQAFKQVCLDFNSSSFIPTRTDIFTGEYVALGVHNSIKSVPATLFDVLLWSDTSRSSIINSVFTKLTIGNCLDLMMPEFVQIITGKRPVLKGIPEPHATFHVNE